MDADEESWFDDDDGKVDDRRGMPASPASDPEDEVIGPMLRLPMRARDADDGDEVELGPRLVRESIRRSSTSSDSDSEGGTDQAKKRIRTSLVEYEGDGASDDEDSKNEVPDAKRLTA